MGFEDLLQTVLRDHQVVGVAGAPRPRVERHRQPCEVPAPGLPRDGHRGGGVDQPAHGQDLTRPDRDPAAPALSARGLLPLDDRDRGAGEGEFTGEGQSGRAGSDHEDVRVACVFHTGSVSTPSANINPVYHRVVEATGGLRERKKLRTRRAISEAAISLFLEHGYDQVSVADVAAAAEVSKRTLFAYFPTKDDLVLHRIADHEKEAARVVRGRGDGEAPLEALHRHLRARLADRDPITGLCDHPQVVAFYRLVSGTPALQSAVVRYVAAGEDALAAALQETTHADSRFAEVTARLAAGQILHVQRRLAESNQACIARGMSVEEREPDALAEADHAFGLLSDGLAPYRG